MPLPRFDKLDDDRRTTILAAAAEEFGERGFDNASYNRIIERAGISKGAMYYYFADKEDLYRTVLGAALAVWLEQVGFPFEADDDKSFWRACEAMYVRSLQFMLDDPRNAALCLSVTTARQRLEGHPALLELNEQMLAWTEQLVLQGQRLGAVRDDIPTDLLVQTALSMMEAGDRWLAARWEQITSDRVEATAAMMIGLFRRIGEPEGAR